MVPFSIRKDWGKMVPALIIMMPALMVPDNRVSPYVEDPALMKKWEQKTKPRPATRLP
jgi:hypothetical protein